MKKTRLEELAEKAVVDCQHSPPRDACYLCVLEALEIAVKEQRELSAAAVDGLIPEWQEREGNGASIKQGLEAAAEAIRHDEGRGLAARPATLVSGEGHMTCRACEQLKELQKKKCLHGGVFRGEKCDSCGEEVT